MQPEKDYREDIASQEGGESDREQALVQLNNLGASLADKRKEAIDARDEEGIEKLWREDEEYYDGVDELTKADTYEKPYTAEGRVTTSARRGVSSVKSTVFVNITQPYVDMGANRAADMLLPTDDKPFGVDATPIPEIDDFVDSEEMMTFPDGSQAMGKDVVQIIKTKADEIAKRSELRIWDWLCESGWHTEARKLLMNTAKIGTGVLKGPFPYNRKVKRVDKDEDGNISVRLEKEVRPKSKTIDAKNLFPDPACGDNIHNGSYVFERDYLTEKQVNELKGGDYLDDQLDKVLKEGPTGSSDPKEHNDKKKKLYEVWYFNGMLGKDDLNAAGCGCGDEVKFENVLITMINNHVIKGKVATLDSGEFPYDVLCWQRKSGKWFGAGIARQVRVPQRMLNASTRKMMDNAGLSSEPIRVFARDGLEPAGGNWNTIPGKTYFADTSAANVRSVKDMIYFFEVPNLQEKFSKIIEYAFALAERLTNMPLLMQGQQGQATETVGGMEILEQNGGTMLRGIAKAVDDYITMPHITRYYEYLLIHGEDPEEKGDNVINARGASVLFERDAQNQAILSLAAVVKDPSFKIDPAKWAEEALRAQKIDPSRIQYTEAEWKEIEKRNAENPPVDPRIAGNKEVAALKVEGDLKKAEMTSASDMNELQQKAKSETDKLTAEAAEGDLKRRHEANMKSVDWEMMLMEFAEKKGITLDEAKVKLADTRMKLDTQIYLSEKPPVKKEVSTPPTEPAQHAKDGKSYEQ